MNTYRSALIVGALTGALAACGPSTPPPQQEARPKIGLLMDTLQEERWQRDRDLFLERAKQVRVKVLVESAERDDAKQLQLADSMLGQNIRVLVVVPHSSEAGAKIRGLPTGARTGRWS